MQARPLLRNVTLFAFAATLGWWAHGTSSTVHAEHLSASNSQATEAPLTFQFGGTEIKDSLTLYNPANHTLYVYPAASGSSKINCAYGLHIDRPGASIQRQNCDVGSLQ